MHPTNRTVGRVGPDSVELLGALEPAGAGVEYQSCPLVSPRGSLPLAVPSPVTSARRLSLLQRLAPFPAVLRAPRPLPPTPASLSPSQNPTGLTSRHRSWSRGASAPAAPRLRSPGQRLRPAPQMRASQRLRARPCRRTRRARRSWRAPRRVQAPSSTVGRAACRPLRVSGATPGKRGAEGAG